MNTIAIRKEININTIVVIVGFLGSFAGFITLWNGIQYRQEDFQKWIESHDALHDVIGAQVKVFADVDAARDKQMIDINFRLGQLEKVEDALSDRLDRITESYGNQFSDIRASLGAISTQLALTNQALQGLIPPSTQSIPPELNHGKSR